MDHHDDIYDMIEYLSVRSELEANLEEHFDAMCEAIGEEGLAMISEQMPELDLRS